MEQNTQYDAVAFGKALQKHRKDLGWTAKQIAFLYSEEIGREDNPVTTTFIYQIEHGAVIMDKGRRAILAQLVDMPLALAGIGLVASHSTVRLFSQDAVNIQEYTSTLETYSSTWALGTTYQYAKDIKKRVSSLEHAALYSPNKAPLVDLLCSYQVLAADVVGEQNPNAAAKILNQTVLLSKQENLPNLYVHALRQRAQTGISVFERTRDFSMLSQSLTDFQATETTRGKVSSFYQGLVDVRKGLVYAYTARDRSEFGSALKILDAAGKQIGQAPDDLRIAARLDLERWRINRASAFLYSPFGAPTSALYELEQLEKDLPDTSPRRSVHRNLLFSEVYLALANYPMATAYAGAALDITTSSHMDTLSHRLESVYRALRNTTYGSNPDTAHLGVTLLKAQQPELF
jgi:tetratricopeptide (TPR) repeat protein